MSTPPDDATTALLRALGTKFPSSAGFDLEKIRSRNWASATFVGARHEMVFTLSGANGAAAADTFVRTLEVAEFPLRGHLLADIVLVGEERAPGLVRISLEALTVEDR